MELEASRYSAQLRQEADQAGRRCSTPCARSLARRPAPAALAAQARRRRLPRHGRGRAGRGRGRLLRRPVPADARRPTLPSSFDVEVAGIGLHLVVEPVWSLPSDGRAPCCAARRWPPTRRLPRAPGARSSIASPPSTFRAALRACARRMQQPCYAVPHAERAAAASSLLLLGDARPLGAAIAAGRAARRSSSTKRRRAAAGVDAVGPLYVAAARRAVSRSASSASIAAVRRCAP